MVEKEAMIAVFDDYHGPMYVSAAPRYNEGTYYYSCGFKGWYTCYTTYASAHVPLDWGYSWACGEHQNACDQFSVNPCSYEACTTYDNVCSDAQISAARDKVSDCLHRVIPNLDTIYGANYGYKPEIDPITQSWPTFHAHGNCETCEVRDDLPLDRPKRMMIAASLLGLVGALFLLFSFYTWVLCLPKQVIVPRECEDVLNAT